MLFLPKIAKNCKKLQKAKIKSHENKKFGAQHFSENDICFRYCVDIQISNKKVKTFIFMISFNVIHCCFVFKNQREKQPKMQAQICDMMIIDLAMTFSKMNPKLLFFHKIFV